MHVKLCVYTGGHAIGGVCVCVWVCVNNNITPAAVFDGGRACVECVAGEKGSAICYSVGARAWTGWHGLRIRECTIFNIVACDFCVVSVGS